MSSMYSVLDCRLEGFQVGFSCLKVVYALLGLLPNYYMIEYRVHRTSKGICYIINKYLWIRASIVRVPIIAYLAQLNRI